MAPAKTCPICQRPLPDEGPVLRFRPFCSKRCADVDLGRWLKGAYAIPAEEPDVAEEDAVPDDSEEPGLNESSSRH